MAETTTAAASNPSNGQTTEDAYVENWGEAGLEAVGPVQFVVLDGTIERTVTKTGPNAGKTRTVAALDVELVARPGRKLDPKPRFFDRFSLDAQYLRRFKALVKAAKVKVPEAGKVSMAEVIRALKGKTAAGIIKHREYEGEKFAEFEGRFAPTIEELIAQRKTWSS